MAEQAASDLNPTQREQEKQKFLQEAAQNIRDLWNSRLSQNEKFQTLLVHGAGIVDVVNALSTDGQDPVRLKQALQLQALDYSESAGIDTYTPTSLVKLP